MKKFLTILLVVAIAFTACYFIFLREEDNASAELNAAMSENSTLYPHYARLSAAEKEAYAKICAATQNFDKEITRVYVGSTKQEVENFLNGMQINVYREIAYENPELFWFDPYNVSYTIVSTANEHYLNLSMSYLFSQEQVKQMKPDFEVKLEKLVNSAKKKTNTYEQVLYVHDYILEHCHYDTEAYENEDFTSASINAYGCLVEGKAICSGYAMAFNAVMKRLGYEVGVEFNTYNGLSIFGNGHVWNYCKLDGEYYYFDLTWDDNGTDYELYDRQPYSHSYFAITTEELEDAHLILAPEAQTPACNGTKYNYFVHNGLNFSEYDFEAVKPVIQSQSDEPYIQLRFDSYSELLSAQSDLITDGKIYTLFPDATGCQYYSSKSGLQLYIFIK